MKQQIHINDQGELLLRIEGQPDVKFRDQEGVADLLFEPFGIPYNRGKSIALHLSQSFDLPNSYTAQVVETCKWHGNRDACANETCWDLQECQKSPAVKVAVLTPLKQEPDNSTSNDIRSETRSGFTICPHSRLACYDPECGVTTNICNNSHCFREPGNEAKKEGAFDGSVQFELDFGDRFIRVNCPDEDNDIHLLIKRNSRYCGISLDLDQAEQLANYILGHVKNARLANPD